MPALPGSAPELSKLVPIFGRALLEERDDPKWREHLADDDPKYKGGLRAGAVTWSRNGLASAPQFSGLTRGGPQGGDMSI